MPDVRRQGLIVGKANPSKLASCRYRQTGSAAVGGELGYLRKMLNVNASCNESSLLLASLIRWVVVLLYIKVKQIVKTKPS